jgi:hypothetical protein
MGGSYLLGGRGSDVAGEPGVVVVPAVTGLVAPPPVGPVFGEAGPGRWRGEQAGDLGNGQR